MKTNQELISHTENPDFENYDKAMESIRDRTVIVNVPAIFEGLPQLWGKFEQQIAYRCVEECVMYFDGKSINDGMLTDIEDAAKITGEDRADFRSQTIISLFCKMHKQTDKTLWDLLESPYNVPKQLKNAIVSYVSQPLKKL